MHLVPLADLTGYLDAYLRIREVPDEPNAVNGLQAENRSTTVSRIVAAVDCGRQINPDVVRQQIEGGLIFGMAGALGGATGFTENLADARTLGDLDLPRLSDTVEFIRSEADPGGVGELGVPAIGPAIANALQASTGYRIRNLPLLRADE